MLSLGIEVHCVLIWWILDYFFCRYTRNLVDEGNGKFNLIVLCWGEGQGRLVCISYLQSYVNKSNIRLNLNPKLSLKLLFFHIQQF